MTPVLSSGKCRLCGELVGKAQMSAHLKKCLKRSAGAPASGGKTAPCFLVLATATYDPAYWLYLELPAEAKFSRLDQVLRDIWLECCGHLSAFSFRTKQVSPKSPMDLQQLLRQMAAGNFADPLDEDDKIMGERMGKRLQPGVKFEYEYDFGSTTNLSFRVLDEYIGSQAKPKLRLLARNEPPDIRCEECGRPATQVCVECQGVAMCKACATKHDCGEEMLLPILNSPRTGVCGYCGPSIEPKH